MKTSVAQTSIAVYRSTDFTTLRGRVAWLMLRMQAAGRPCFIRSIAQTGGLDKSTVAGRMNELRKQPFFFNGELYHIVSDGLYIDNEPGKRPVTVNAWKMVPYKAASQEQHPTLFQPVEQ